MSQEQFEVEVIQEIYIKENEMKNIYSAFIKAQQQFAPALKSSLNPHFKSKYASLDNCIEAVIDAFNDNGIGLIQQTHEAESGVIIETILIHTSGEQLSGGKLFVPATKLDAQGFGSALTYARRYSLMATCGIAPEDDDGNAASKQPVKQSPAPNLKPPVLDIFKFKQMLISSKDEVELKTAWATIYPQIKNTEHLSVVQKEYDDMKSLFNV